MRPLSLHKWCFKPHQNQWMKLLSGGIPVFKTSSKTEENPESQLLSKIEITLLKHYGRFWSKMIQKINFREKMEQKLMIWVTYTSRISKTCFVKLWLPALIYAAHCSTFHLILIILGTLNKHIYLFAKIVKNFMQTCIHGQMVQKNIVFVTILLILKGFQKLLSFEIQIGPPSEPSQNLAPMSMPGVIWTTGLGSHPKSWARRRGVGPVSIVVIWVKVH
jgi:hypothetical protein